jgi:hypothetical protein
VADETLDSTGGDWAENRRHVLTELGRQGRTIEHLDRRLDSISDSHISFKTEVLLKIADLKFKQGMWGVIGAGLPTIAMGVLWWLTHK